MPCVPKYVGQLYIIDCIQHSSREQCIYIYHKSWILCVCGLIYIMIVQEFHVVPCCLHRLLSSPVEAVIRYCQPSGYSYHIQVEHVYSFPLCCVMGEKTGELQKLQTVLKVCVTVMSNLSTSVCYRELGRKKKKEKQKCRLYGGNPCMNPSPNSTHKTHIFWQRKFRKCHSSLSVTIFKNFRENTRLTVSAFIFISQLMQSSYPSHCQEDFFLQPTNFSLKILWPFIFYCF